jgi:hypothetical protein
MKLEGKQGTQSFVHLSHIILVPILGCGINKELLATEQQTTYARRLGRAG